MTGQSVSGVAEKRVRLVQAAARSFARVGFDRASVDEIADSAEVAKGTVYLYFEKKDELFLACLWELKERLEQVVSSYNSAPTVLERGRAYIRAHLSLADLYPDLFRCYTSALFGVNRDFQNAALETFQWQQNCLLELLHASKRYNEAAVVVACINAAALVRTLEPGAATFDAAETLLPMLVSFGDTKE